MKKILIIFGIISLIAAAVLINLNFKQKKEPQPTKLIPIKKDNKWGYCDKNKKIIIEPKFDEVTFFDTIKYIAEVKFNGQKFFIDTTGKIVDGPLTNCSTFSEGFAIASQNGKYGFINNKGEFVIKPTFQECKPFSQGLAAVKMNNKWGYIDSDGDYVIDPNFQDCYSFVGDFAIVKINDKWGIIDKDGKYTVNPNFKSSTSI